MPDEILHTWEDEPRFLPCLAKEPLMDVSLRALELFFEADREPLVPMSGGLRLMDGNGEPLVYPIRLVSDSRVEHLDHNGD
ncbi:MAG: hypothetical protein F4Z77_11815 [Dehalococcoidia bacterium]|nr:hypothetical protein [Dehalococcoidia bacterium]MYA52551.1 hypothetical protein [Dehalococcoidia bacterium]